jgi:hypothetical protein
VINAECGRLKTPARDRHILYGLGRATLGLDGWPIFALSAKVGLFPSAGATPKSFPMDTGNAYHFGTGGEQERWVPHPSLIRAGSRNAWLGKDPGAGSTWSPRNTW